ncbi:MAG: cytochrome P450 [Alphaproteobacteria bacterium]|nr:MAG: cytochrome P450 [Alphaproteobacteria bacterium]
MTRPPGASPARSVPPKPRSRPEGRVGWLRYLALFREDIFASQPARLYRARMAEFRTPFFRSFLVNEPELVRLVLNERPDDFPKSERVGEGLRPLLGNSVFVTNGETWKRQRRIIDPAFEGGRLRETYPAMLAAAEAARDRLGRAAAAGPVEIEEQASFAAADVIFRTLFSVPITDEVAARVFHAFRAHQRAQPLLNLGAFFRLPRWVPRFRGRRARRTAREIRALITAMTRARMDEIARGAAPDDLATKIMTTADPETGERFDTAEMVDQVAIFFLAGHETSASALAWALYLLATHPEAQARVLDEVRAVAGTGLPEFGDLARLAFTRNVFREALRLYPPVPMMVREATRPERFRDRDVPVGSQIVIAPFFLHRHERHWDNPDAFDPDRFETEAGRRSARLAYLPFSAGPRVCTGAGFAMIEGVLMLAALVGAFHFAPAEDRPPRPVAHLTVRALGGIRLVVTPRN